MSGLGALSTRQSPPLAVPLRFFLSMPLFLMLAGVVLMLADPDRLGDRWSPQVLALAHLWVLGMMLLVMIGAVQQVIPVLLGVPLWRPERISALSHALLFPGILLLVGAFLFSRPALFPLAAALLLAGLLPVVLAALAALWRAPTARATAWGIRLALLALLVTLGLGIWLALGNAGAVPLRRDWTDLHLAWGLLGWSVLLLTAVAWQVVPMFQITPRYPPGYMALFAPWLLLSLLAWMAGREYPRLPWLEPAGAVLLSLALVSFALVTLNLQRQRKRRIADATVEFWRLSMLCLLAAVFLWWAGRAGLPVPVLLPGILLAAGFIGSAIVGMLYKIVPFLVWLHLTNQAQILGLLPAGIPNMKQVIPSARSRLALRLYLAWMALLVLLPFRPAWLAPPAGLLLVTLGGLLGWHLLAAVRLYGRHLSRIRREAPAGR